MHQIVKQSRGTGSGQIALRLLLRPLRIGVVVLGTYESACQLKPLRIQLAFTYGRTRRWKLVSTLRMSSGVSAIRYFIASDSQPWYVYWPVL